jgi:Protein of unknown function (DUF1488)
MPLHYVKCRGHSPTTMSVRFVLHDGEKDIQCAVSDEAMDDAEHAKGIGPRQRDEQFGRLKDHIVNCASRKYFAGQFERGENPRIMVKTADLTLR